MLDSLLITISIIFSIVVLAFSLKTLFDTRKKYYKDYLRRKRNGKH